MGSNLPKVMHKIAGLPLINHVITALEKSGVEDIIAVVGPDMDTVVSAASPYQTVEQTEQSGTGSAVKVALDIIPDTEGHVLVLFGADPLIQSDTIAHIAERCQQPDKPSVVVLGYRMADPDGYGRLITDETGQLTAIIESKEADADTLKINLCNSGIMAIDRKLLRRFISQISNDNKKGEYYLTDIVAIAQSEGYSCAFVEGNTDDFIGVDSRQDLAAAEAAIQKRLRQKTLAGGATLVDPSSVHFSFDTQIGADAEIEPFVVFGPGVKVHSGATIRSFSHLEGCEVLAGAIIGPYARLRPGTEIREDAKIGNFVEVKNATFEAGAKANHLSYIGDARVGAKANIGAGTITCNYDGFNKSRTDIGAGAFIGSNSALVAPVTIGDGAIVGAGSTIAKDVSKDALALTRAPQKAYGDYAVSFRKNKAEEKQRAKNKE